MNSISATVCVALVLSLGGAASAPAQPPAKPADPAQAAGPLIDLRPKFEKGQKVGYIMRLRSSNEVGGVPGGDGKPTRQQTDQEIGILMRVVEADREKGATVEMVYESVKIKIQSALGDVEVDTTKPAKAPARKPDAIDELVGPEAIDKAVREMVGATLTLTVDTDGRIASVKGGEKLAAGGMLGQLGIVLPDARGLSGLFGPISSRGASGAHARVGEKWSTSTETETSPLGPMKMSTDYTLTGVRGPLAEVFFKGRIEARTDAGGNGSPLQIKDTFYQGQYTWDTKMGWLEKMTSEQRIAVEGRAQGLPGSSKMESLVTVERRKGK